nr:RNA-directed DNA polymerase, eukaryota [Tanacetum cinerariifolium]
GRTNSGGHSKANVLPVPGSYVNVVKGSASSVLIKDSPALLVSSKFVSDERVVWVDIEGVPLHLWSRDTFIKFGSKWGETMDLEENLGSSFDRKRLCIKTKVSDNILEKFKIIHNGKVYMYRPYHFHHIQDHRK